MLQDDTTVRNADAMAREAVLVLDIFLSAYANEPGTGLVNRMEDDDLLTWGHLRSILATLSPADGATGVEGMVLVPREPTEAMLRSAARRLFCHDEGREVGESSLRYWIDSPDENDAAVARDLREQATVAWSAMLAALTPTETGEQGK